MSLYNVNIYLNKIFLVPAKEEKKVLGFYCFVVVDVVVLIEKNAKGKMKIEQSKEL